MLLRLIRTLPDVKFLCVKTAWTTGRIEKMLKASPNCEVMNATADLEGALYGRARALLAPSLLPEAYGLVVMEAALRGIPSVSSDSGGLVEANPLSELVVPTKLFFDMNTQKLERGVGCHDIEEMYAAENARTGVESELGGEASLSLRQQC